MVFAEHLRTRAADYFPDRLGAPPKVTLDWKKVRYGCALYAFDVAMGPEREKILIKVLPPLDDGEPPTGDPAKDRPRRTYGLDPRLRSRLEYTMLATLHEEIQARSDPRLDAVRVYDILPEARAIVMELLPHPNVRDFVGLPWRRPGRGEGPDPTVAFRNAGAWLNMYHGLSRLPHLTSRHTRRDEFIAFTVDLTEFLARSLGRSSFFDRVAQRVERAASTSLPDALPAGLGHGDYAMRNVLVGPEGAVSVIDTMGRWQTAIYEDIGCFLTDLKCNRLQVLTRGWFLGTRSRIYEKVFLEGYFGPQIPIQPVRLYEIQACLDKWASIAAWRRRVENLRSRIPYELRLRLASGYFQKAIEGCLRDLPD